MSSKIMQWIKKVWNNTLFKRIRRWIVFHFKCSSLTLKELLYWFLVSFSIPIMNAGLIMLIRKKIFYNMEMLHILIVANVCFMISIPIYRIVNNQKRAGISIFYNVLILFPIVFMIFSILEIENIVSFINIKDYFRISFFLTALSVVFGFISTYDKQMAKYQQEYLKTLENDKKQSLVRINEVNNITSATIENKEVKL